MGAETSKSAEQLPTDEVLKQLGARIKALRIAKGHQNYEKFAFEHNISRSQYWRYEQGEDLKFSSLLRIVKALDISLDEFFSDGFERPVKR
jgi:transcriptional regulator with XRE-family HTH domain